MKRFRVLDGLLGMAVGDALGVPAEFRRRETFVKDPMEDMIDQLARRDDIFDLARRLQESLPIKPCKIPQKPL